MFRDGARVPGADSSVGGAAAGCRGSWKHEIKIHYASDFGPRYAGREDACMWRWRVRRERSDVSRLHRVCCACDVMCDSKYGTDDSALTRLEQSKPSCMLSRKTDTESSAEERRVTQPYHRLFLSLSVLLSSCRLPRPLVARAPPPPSAGPSRTLPAPHR
eukprot:2882921-Rhodomonas_salina.1